MKNLLALALVACFASSVLPCLAQATDSPAQAQAVLNRLLQAVKDNDYNAFVQDGTPQFMAGMTKQMLMGVHGQLAPRMEGGYVTEFMGKLNQSGMDVFVYKLIYSAGGDDTLVKLVLDGNKVAGFWLQ